MDTKYIRTQKFRKYIIWFYVFNGLRNSGPWLDIPIRGYRRRSINFLWLLLEVHVPK